MKGNARELQVQAGRHVPRALGAAARGRVLGLQRGRGAERHDRAPTVGSRPGSPPRSPRSRTSGGTRSAPPSASAAMPTSRRRSRAATARRSRPCCRARPRSGRVAGRRRRSAACRRSPSRRPSPSSARRERSATIVAAVPLTDAFAAHCARARASQRRTSSSSSARTARSRVVEASLRGTVELPLGVSRSVDRSATRYRALGTRARSGQRHRARGPDAELGDHVRDAGADRPAAGRARRLAAPDRDASPTSPGARSSARWGGSQAPRTRSQPAACGSACPVKGATSSPQLGRAFNQMASELEARLDDLEEERRRLREANARFGDALAATLDPEQLRRVIVESAVEATQARRRRGRRRGRLVRGDRRRARGRRAARVRAQQRVGRSFGRLMLVGDGFDDRGSG